MHSPLAVSSDAMTMQDEGKVCTGGNSFRARAEARQRWYRAHRLHQPWGDWGHRLALASPPEETCGNFVCDEARKAAMDRAASGKGVDVERTFGNMLSSQAMCFNVFGPLMNETGRAVAARVLRRFVPGLATVERIELEHTPCRDIFNDQKGPSGVDCDVLIDFSDEAGQGGVLVIETKFVETKFSVCGFRKRTSKTRCPQEVVLGERCCYTARKGYRYWEQTSRLGTLAMDKVRAAPCPFGGQLWQLWVNHTLAHALAECRRPRRAARAVFAVCAPRANDALLQGGSALDDFRQWVADPSTVMFIALEELIEALASEAPEATSESWIDKLRSRYIVDTAPPAGAAAGAADPA